MWEVAELVGAGVKNTIRFFDYLVSWRNWRDAIVSKTIILNWTLWVRVPLTPLLPVYAISERQPLEGCGSGAMPDIGIFL